MLFTGEILFRRFEIHSDGFTIELVHILIWHSYTRVNRTLSYVTLPVRLKTISICGIQSYVFISDNGAEIIKIRDDIFVTYRPVVINKFALIHAKWLIRSFLSFVHNIIAWFFRWFARDWTETMTWWISKIDFWPTYMWKTNKKLDHMMRYEYYVATEWIVIMNGILYIFVLFKL